MTMLLSYRSPWFAVRSTTDGVSTVTWALAGEGRDASTSVAAATLALNDVDMIGKPLKEGMIAATGAGKERPLPPAPPCAAVTRRELRALRQYVVHRAR